MAKLCDRRAIREQPSNFSKEKGVFERWADACQEWRFILQQRALSKISPKTANGLFYPSRTLEALREAKAVRLGTIRTKKEHRRMPFENERDDILFTIRMGLMLAGQAQSRNAMSASGECRRRRSSQS